MFRKVAIVSALFCLVGSGCVATYPVVGSFDNHNEVFVGTVISDLLAGQSEIVVNGKVSGLSCKGRSNTTYIPPISYVIPTCTGQRGDVVMRCADGRAVKGEWTATSCTTGYGRGSDQNGNIFSFTFGLSEQEALAFVESERKIAAQKPDLPAYRPKEVRKEKGFSTGTGFFVTDNGVIITNFHVIEDSKRVVVVRPGDKTEHVAEILQVDPTNDVAILRIQATSLSIPIASSSDVVRGQEILTLGYPLVAIQGQEQKATFGRINALTGLKDDIRLMQIDAPIQPGNSGSPLINKRGQVVGVVTATLSSIVTLRSTGALPQNVNFAVKSDYILPTLRAALNNRYAAPSGIVSEQSMERVVAMREASVVLVIAR